MYRIYREVPFSYGLRLLKKEGRDYTGHVPRLLGDPALTTYVHGVLQQELLLSTRQALIIPPASASPVLCKSCLPTFACSVSHTRPARTDGA